MNTPWVLIDQYRQSSLVDIVVGAISEAIQSCSLTWKSVHFGGMILLIAAEGLSVDRLDR